MTAMTTASFVWILCWAGHASAVECHGDECRVDETFLLQTKLKLIMQREANEMLDTTVQGQKPHILFVVADDLGKSNIGFSAKLAKQATGTDSFEAQPSYTPKTTLLAEQGIILNRHYSFLSCTPSRAALLSGRLPVHIGVKLGEPETWDGGHDKMWGYEGLAPNMTLLPAYLKYAGYATHAVGKADGFGVATPQHTPTGRGFDSFLGYFSHGNDYWNYRNDLLTDAALGTPQLGGAGGTGQCDGLDDEIDDPDVFDLTENDHAAPKAAEWKKTGKYEEEIFVERALEIINAHDIQQPLFLFYASHLVHNPLQVPDVYYNATAKKMCEYNPGCLTENGTCSLLNQDDGRPFGSARARPSSGTCALVERIQLLAMATYLDDVVDRLVSALKQKGMWDNTFLLFASDNGGGLGFQIGGNNWPLKGSKGGDWEGGYLTPAFISGGRIPTSLRGTTRNQAIHISDWFTTFVELAGVSQSYRSTIAINEKQMKLPSISGVNVWPSIEDSVEPHDVIHLGPKALLMRDGNRWYKILVGTIANTIWSGPDYPNTTCQGFGLGGVTMPEIDDFETIGMDNFTWTQKKCRESQAQGSTGACRPPNPAPIGPPSLPTQCGIDSLTGCLYDLTTDPYETNNLAPSEGQRWTTMYEKLLELNKEYFEPFRGCSIYSTKLAYCKAAINHHNRTYGPFLNVDGCGDSCIYTTSQYKEDCAAGLIENCVKQATHECHCHINESDCQGDDLCKWDTSEQSCHKNPNPDVADDICKSVNNLASLV